jgi:hypothetical protein
MTSCSFLNIASAQLKSRLRYNEFSPVVPVHVYPQWLLGVLSPEVEQQGREADLPLPLPLPLLLLLSLSL